MIVRRLVLGGLGSLAVARTAGAQVDDGFNGAWTGVLQVGGGQTLKLRLVIEANGKATFYSLDQGGEPIPARIRKRSATEIEVESAPIRAKFVGKLVSPDRIEGTFIQGMEMPLVMLRGDAGLSAAPAPEAPAAPLTAELLESYRAAGGLPALAAAAEAGGKRINLATGERVAGSGVRVTAEDIWHMGSITKSMTATLIGRLVDQGKVSWDDTVGELLKDVAPDMRPEYRSATFRHLLSHRAGLQANLPITDFLAYSRDLDDPREERRRFVRKALRQTPKGPMEKTFEYSNNGYVAAGAMLEARLGESWETLIRRELFQPLGLSSAGFGAPGTREPISQPAGHSQKLLGGLNAHRPGDGITDNPAVLGPAGRVHMSLSDMLTYLAAHRDRTSLLKPGTWEVLHTVPFGGDYAMGWVVRPDGTRWHNGSNTLWYAEAMFNTDKGWVATAAANDGRVQVAGPQLSKALKSAAAAV